MSVIAHAERRMRAASIVAAAALGLVAMGVAATPVSAHGRVSIGIGLGFPIFAAPVWGGYYGPYYNPYYYAPPPVVYAPPPVVYRAPPAYYGPAYYGYGAPLEATPASPVYQSPSGQYCREYRTTVRVGGHYEEAYGTACQKADGSWRVEN